MTFEFTASLHFDFITGFAQLIGVPLQNNVLQIPQALGEGYVRKIEFGSDFRLLIHHYTLKEDLIIKRNPAAVANDLLSIFFYNNEQPIDLIYNEEKPVRFSQKNESAIQITTNDLSSLIRFPANTETHYVVVGITASRLASLIGTQTDNHIIRTLTSGTSSFLYFESMNGETTQLLKNMALVNMHDTLSHFLLQIKVLELLHSLISKLSKREDTIQQSITSADAEKLLVVRSIILADLSEPPLIHTLATAVGMSETRLKQLFKQTFGDSIYNYYQKIRMEEAAFLLRQTGYSVSEVGYGLGFTNLSHFSRLFQRHYNINPKKYSSTR
jgi:AraC-like DNA-binding protein